MRRLLPLVLLACAACSAGGGEPVTLLDYQALVPASFQARPASSSMRLAEYDVPRTDGTHAEMIVFYFGPGQGGSADANIARWSGQFTGPDGGAVAPHVMDADGTAFPTTIAEFEGAYARGTGMGIDVEPEADQAMVAAVVETPRGNLFLQLVGDSEAVAATREDFLDMVTSIRPSDGA